MSILFINGSPNPDGNTAGLAKILLNGKNYETLNLTDYVIGVYGQKLPNDQGGRCTCDRLSTLLAQHLWQCAHFT